VVRYLALLHSRKVKKKKTVLTEDLDEKAALNGSFELNGSATGWFVFVLLNGSETSTWHTITTHRHKIIECTKQTHKFQSVFPIVECKQPTPTANEMYSTSPSLNISSPPKSELPPPPAGPLKPLNGSFALPMNPLF